MTNKTQWQKRVDVTQYIYSCLVKGLTTADEIKADVLKYTLDANQLKLIEYFADNQEEITKLITGYLKENWSWERLAYMQRSIMIVAYCETIVLKTPKAVAIDQALVTANKYGQLKEKGFINAVLDKLLK